MEKKINTYFASATWYDDDDSEVCHPVKHQSIKGLPVTAIGNLSKYEPRNEYNLS